MMRLIARCMDYRKNPTLNHAENAKPVLSTVKPGVGFNNPPWIVKCTPGMVKVKPPFGRDFTVPVFIPCKFH